MHKQTSKKASQDSSNTPVQSQFQSRPFAVQAQIEAPTLESAKPELESKEKNIQKSSYNLANILLSNSPPEPPKIQPKLTIGQVGDKYEKEADLGASQVVSQINTPIQKTLQRRSQAEKDALVQPKLSTPQHKPLQRRSQAEQVVTSAVHSQASKPFIKPLQSRSLTKNIQRQESVEQEDEELMMKPMDGFIQRREAIAGGTATSDLESAIQSARGGGQSLDADLQQSMGQAMEADFSGVKVHTDSQSDQLNKSIQAKAFTTGQDVFFRQGAYEPASRGGQELIAHELTHVVQQNGGAVQRSPQIQDLEPQQPVVPIESSGKETPSNTVQRVFNPTAVVSNAHLRNDGVWGTHIGSKIPSGAEILVDDDGSQNKAHKHWVGSDTIWKPAINIPPNSTQTNIPANQKGYIRNVRVGAKNGSLEAILKARIQTVLMTAEGRYPSLATHLNKAENIDFLLTKAIRHNVWNASASLDTFVAGFSTKEDKIARIQAGADYVAESLEHWRKWLNDDPTKVVIEEVKFLQSDLHEQGLGVIKVKFRKPLGPRGHKFADQTNVEAIIKPEDKSLEENLLGDSPDSAANKINTIVGLTDPNEMLTTIKMSSDANYGSLVEKVQGSSAEDLTKAAGLKPMRQAFHETLVFAFLAGIDDLHKENVYWDDGKPYLIDADNVLSYNQMINKDNGGYTQSGFGGNYNVDEAKENKKAVKTADNSVVNSKILKAMIEDKGKALKIIDAIKGAIAGQEGRVVPISTRQWGQRLTSYTTSSVKDDILNQISTKDSLVREGKAFDTGIGPGLIGTSFKNIAEDFYDSGAEKKELKKDFDAGVIPFYVYEFDTGHVFHNGTKIYHGQTLEQAMQVMLNKFGHV